MMVSAIDFLQRIWQELWQELRTPPPPLQPLLDAYSEPQRHYHTLQHLRECLTWWQRCKQWMQRPVDVALALFYHDVVYQPKKADNEAKSALWLQQHLHGHLPEAQLQRIQQWVLATASHQHHGDEADLAWVLDIDLSILSADTTRFQEYERQIRLEYRHVPSLIYRCKRRQILRQFAQRQPLYLTHYFKTHLEAQAKRNLQAA